MFHSFLPRNPPPTIDQISAVFSENYELQLEAFNPDTPIEMDQYTVAAITDSGEAMVLVTTLVEDYYI